MDGRTKGFEQERPRLTRIAYRMLGSAAEAEDVVQEAFVRWHAVDEPREPQKLLTTIVTRLCLDVLKSARVKRQTYVGQWLPEIYVDDATPELTGELADNLSYGFMTMLERLTPPQRAVFVFRTAFDLEYGDIAGLLGTSEASCRQLMKRARERVAGPARYTVDAARGQLLAQRFAEACNSQSQDALLGLLSAECQLLSDGGGHLPTARKPVLGHDRVARLLVALRAKYGARLSPLPKRSGASPLLRYEQDNGFRGVAVLDLHGDGDSDPNIVGVYLHWNPDKLRHFAL